MTTMLSSFERDGFIGPVRILTPHECKTLRRHFEDSRRPQPADWHKGRAVTDRLLYRLAADPRVIQLVTHILGNDIVLWGCSVVRLGPGEVHPWHVDIETSDPDGRYVTVWIGLENTSRSSGLQLIAGSQAFRKTIQQIQHENGYCRGEAPTDDVLAWASESSASARLVQPQLGDGEAIVFDGLLWHKSENDRAGETRRALLLQFASADSPVRMPDPRHLEWPFRFLSAPRPPVVVTHGAAVGDANRLVPPPAPNPKERMPMLSSCIRSLDMPLAERPGGGWQPHHLFKGSTRVLDHLTCHAAVLSGGHSPHPPHVHREEELLVVLDGEAELLIADAPTPEGARVERVSPGAFSYYPAGQHHSIRNPGTAPVTYLMFKWHVEAAKAARNPLGTTIFHYGDEPEPDGSKGFVTHNLFRQPTNKLGRLHCHTTWLAPGAGYEPHVDAHDVAILMLSGRVETLGQEVGPHSVIYYSAGELHGMRNIGDEPARYLVFEFHAPSYDFGKRIRRRVKPLARRFLRPVASAIGIRRGSSRSLSS